jgi:hypothetical protein
MKKLLTLIGLFAFALVASAQTDITSRLGTTSLGAATTNTSSLTVPIGWTRDQIITFEIVTKATNANSGNVFYSFKESVSGSYYKAATKTATVSAANGTNTVFFNLTNNLGTKYLSIESAGNTNATAGGTITILKASTLP